MTRGADLFQKAELSALLQIWHKSVGSQPRSPAIRQSVTID